MPDRRIVAAAGLVAVLLLSGCAGASAGSPAPPTASPAASGADTGRAAGPQDPVAEDDDPDASIVPLRVRIPRIDVDAGLLDIAVQPDGILEAPPPDRLDEAGWYADGTVPGRTGPAIIAGHVDWVDRAAVFHRLAELRPGDEVAVALSDGSTARFTVDRLQSVDKTSFPTAAVYGPTPDAQLRLITCGGPWDDARNIYSENLIVFATRSV